MEWTYISLVHTDDDYGVAGAQSVQDYAEARGVCISKVLKVNVSPENLVAHFRHLTYEMITDETNATIYFGQNDAGKNKLVCVYLLKKYMLCLKEVFV